MLTKKTQSKEPMPNMFMNFTTNT